MPTDSIYLLGAGGHARVVFDALVVSGTPMASIQVRDDKPQTWPIDQVNIGQPLIDDAVSGQRFHVAIGNGAARERIYHQIEGMGAVALTVVHPAAVLSPFCQVSAGAFIAATAVVSAAASIGRGVIVNHGAVVDHDCVVGNFSHIAPGATLAGAVHVGERTLIGAGANVLPGIIIGSDVSIGAGAVVIHNVPDGQTWAGVPACPIQRS